MRIKLLLLFIFFSSVIGAQEEAKDPRQVYLQAEEEYNIGHFENSILLLNSNMNLFTGTLKASVYRLIALCHLGQDNPAEAEKNVSTLLKIAPYHSVSIHDPLRFADMVERLKKGDATITTASQQAETVEESPVPITLITEEMLAAIGATSLKEALMAYVPGITPVESQGEDNVSMRGIYASGQQKILIMLNGRRLNSHSTNTAAPDYSMSLEKVKRIEVLRGPASSLYGSIALTAVVNLITKDGRDIDGVSLKAGIGNNGQQKADFLYGKRYLDLEVLAWASVYKSDGQSVFVPASEQYALLPQDGDMVIGGYNRKPSYDFGCTLNFSDWNLLFSRSHTKKVLPLGATIFCSPYGYNNYNDYDGEGAGHSVTSTNAQLTFQKSLNDIHLSAQTFFNQNEATNYDPIGNVPKNIFFVVLSDNSGRYSPTENVFQYLHWEDYSLGATFKIETNYRIGANQSGTLIGGVEYEYFCLHDSYFLGGENNKVVAHSYIDNEKETVPNLVKKGHEQVANAFLQTKHYFTPNLLLNAGLRFDYKARENKHSVTAFSPRVSLVYLKNRLNFKLSFSRAFVDAPYFMRNTLLRTYQGGSDLQPEYLNSIQFTTQINHLLPNFNFEGNLFYNGAYNTIVLTRSEVLGQHYANAASMKMAGIEIVCKYQSRRWLMNLNTTFQQVVSGNNFATEGSYVRNVPKMTGNVVLSYKLLDNLRTGNLSIHTHLSCMSKQKTRLSVRPLGVETVIDKELPGSVLTNMGLHYQWKKLSLSGDVKNLFNKRYELGGSSIVPIQQLGRQVLFQIGYVF